MHFAVCKNSNQELTNYFFWASKLTPCSSLILKFCFRIVSEFEEQNKLDSSFLNKFFEVLCKLIDWLVFLVFHFNSIEKLFQFVNVLFRAISRYCLEKNCASGFPSSFLPMTNLKLSSEIFLTSAPSLF